MAREYPRCFMCHRKLKNPEYRKIGIGPKCLKKYEAKKKDKVVQLELF